MCPDGHGSLYELPSGRMWCPSQEHDPRPKRHPEGERPASRAFFSMDEAYGWTSRPAALPGARRTRRPRRK